MQGLEDARGGLLWVLDSPQDACREIVGSVPTMNIVRVLRKSPVQTFLLVPLATVAWEWALGTLHVELVFLPVMIWGYLQYRLCGRYRIRLGGGGPGLSGAPPERLVDNGIYAWTRHPLYLRHNIYMVGVALVFASWFAA